MGIVREAHVSRLKFNADKSLNVDEELLSHVAHNADGYVVDQLVDCRFNLETATFEILVKLYGLQEIENSSEPAINLLEDIPELMKRYTHEHVDNMMSAMAASLGLEQSFAGLLQICHS
ncbi:hypothetical protein AeNC1_017009 [Aphanomyces euteiches]|nr:hypothetical protein AeNC1_017009 [Aphanomyces euteiches]